MAILTKALDSGGLPVRDESVGIKSGPDRAIERVDTGSAPRIGRAGHEIGIAGLPPRGIVLTVARQSYSQALDRSAMGRWTSSCQQRRQSIANRRRR
jgi:hypothetical protein